MWGQIVFKEVSRLRNLDRSKPNLAQLMAILTSDEEKTNCDRFTGSVCSTRWNRSLCVSTFYFSNTVYSLNVSADRGRLKAQMTRFAARKCFLGVALLPRSIYGFEICKIPLFDPKVLLSSQMEKSNNFLFVTDRKQMSTHHVYKVGSGNRSDVSVLIFHTPKRLIVMFRHSVNNVKPKSTKR